MLPVSRAEDCYVYISPSQRMTVRTSMNLRKDSERKEIYQIWYFRCYSLIMRNRLQTKKYLVMIADTLCFCLLTEPNCQPSNLLVREKESADPNAPALWSSALWSFPKESISQDISSCFLLHHSTNTAEFFRLDSAMGSAPSQAPELHGQAFNRI